MDHGLEALVGFVRAHGDTLELLELAEEVLDQMTPFVHLGVDLERGGAARMLRDHDLGAALIEVGDDVVAVEGLVSNQGAELDALDQRRDSHRVVALSRQQDESDEVAQGIGEGEDFGRHAALGFAYGLALSPPFAPCPWRWTLTMVASTMAYSISGSSETASNIRLNTSAFTQSRKRVKVLFQWPNDPGKSRQGLPVRAIQSTASTNSRLFLPLRPGSPGLPRHSGSIFAHWASLNISRSIDSLNHNKPTLGILIPNRP